MARRRNAPAYECSFCGEELTGAWEFPLHRCEPMAQLEIVVARVVARFAQRGPGAPAPPTRPEDDPLYQARRRAAELIADLARKSGLRNVTNLEWKDIAQFQTTFEEAWRAAKVAAHPDRGGSEELFHTVQQAAELLKKHFSSGG